MVGYSAGWNNGAIGGSGVAGEKAEENHGSMFGQLVALAKNLQNLSLTVLGSHYSVCRFLPFLPTPPPFLRM